jgi:hypothetical protein
VAAFLACHSRDGYPVKDLARFAESSTKDDENNTTDKPATTMTEVNFFAWWLPLPVLWLVEGLSFCDYRSVMADYC